jgi:hypothetical protein
VESTCFTEMTYTAQELEVFAACSKLFASGCKTSHDMGRAVYRAVWWITPLETQRLVKIWCMDKLKIEAELDRLNTVPKDLVRNVQDHSPESTPGCGGASCASSQSF